MPSTMGYRARRLRRRDAGRKKGKRAAAPSPEDRALLKLVICGAVFVALVAVKLLFPQAVDRLAQTAGELLGRDADFKEAFAAMGRAVSGEEPVGDSLQDAYTAVFGPASHQEGEPTLTAGRKEVSREVPLSGAAGLSEAERLLQYAALPLPEALGGTAEPSGGGQPSGETTLQELAAVQTAAGEEDAVTAQLSYVYTMPALPENASLELRRLGFAYDSPLLGSLSSPFGWREHPVTGGNKFHYGVDLAAAEGDTICAFADGRVYATGESSTLGKYVILEHQGGYRTLYAHCSAVTVTTGAVELGEKIAEVGDTGVATGPHLHFELQDGTLYLNPIYYVELQ